MFSSISVKELYSKVKAGDDGQIKGTAEGKKVNAEGG